MRLLRKSHRPAFSLLEVILALAIFGASMAVIGQLMRLGLNAAEASRNDTAAQLLCECKIAEIAAGIDPPDPVFESPLDPNGDWVYTVESERSEQQSLIALRVTVRPATTAANSPGSFTLVRWIVDPAFEMEGRDLEAEQALMEDERISQSKAAKTDSSAAAGASAANQQMLPPNLLNGQNGQGQNVQGQNGNNNPGAFPGGLLPPNLQGQGGGRGGPGGRGDGQGGRGGGQGGRGGGNGPGGGRGGNGPGNFNPGNFGPGGNGPGGPNLPNAPQLPSGQFPQGGGFGS